MSMDLLYSEIISNYYRRNSCRPADHHFHFAGYAPTIKPKAFVGNPSPMCLGPLNDHPYILEKLDLNEGQHCYSDDEQNKKLKKISNPISKLKVKFEDDNNTDLNPMAKSESKNAKKFKSVMNLCKIIKENEEEEEVKFEKKEKVFKNFKKELFEDKEEDSEKNQISLMDKLINEEGCEMEIMNIIEATEDEPSEIPSYSTPKTNYSPIVFAASPRKSILNHMENKRKLSSTNANAKDNSQIILMV